MSIGKVKDMYPHSFCSFWSTCASHGSSGEQRVTVYDSAVFTTKELGEGTTEIDAWVSAAAGIQRDFVVSKTQSCAIGVL